MIFLLKGNIKKPIKSVKAGTIKSNAANAIDAPDKVHKLVFYFDINFLNDFKVKLLVSSQKRYQLLL